MSARALRVGAGVLAVLSASCGATTRFALRPPVSREDDRLFTRVPAREGDDQIAGAADNMVLRPVAQGLLFEPSGEARDVNALDEVPDSSWFTNRSPTPAEVERGGCGDDVPTAPFTVVSTKVGGTTPGLVVTDALGQRYVMKIDDLGPAQPEASTAADAIVSRLYWAVGFNVPCNRVIYVPASTFVRGPRSVERLSTGEERPLGEARLREILGRGTHRPDGSLRIGANRFVDGEGIGTWRTEGTRDDDPNDVVPHEDRRELRGDRFLAAWVAHWDSGRPQSYDAFVRVGPRGGHVVHYFMDFSESLGGVAIRPPIVEPRLGHESLLDVPTITVDAIGFGLVRRPWDEGTPDPRYPDFRLFGVARFDPMGFAPQTPVVRWARAQPSDLAWMARVLARLGVAQIRAAVRSGRYSDPAEEEGLVQILLGRRRRILQSSFARSSPLADVAMVEGRLCATDLGVTSGLSADERLSYAAELRPSESAAPTPVAVWRDGAHVCIEMPRSRTFDHAPDDDPRRYVVVDVFRIDGRARTILRAHLYDEGPGRGHVLVGLERP